MFDGMSRRSFVKGLAISAVASSARGQDRSAAAGAPAEWSYTSTRQYADPFNQVDVDAVITLPSGSKSACPHFGEEAPRGACAMPRRRQGLTESVPSAATPATGIYMTAPHLLNVEPYVGQNSPLQTWGTQNCGGWTSLPTCRRYSILLVRRYLVDEPG